MTRTVRSLIIIALTLFSAAIFVDSLRYKFTNHPNTQEIFGRLSEWITSLGLPDLFAQSGIFSQYVIGTAELIASLLLLVGLLPRFVKFGALGNLIALGVMTGAVSFHLFTPLGIDPNNDGGGLFAAAVAVWASQIIMLFLRRETVVALLKNPLTLLKAPG